MDNAWLFPDPPNVAVITTKRIVSSGWPILLVTHDLSDGGWQFLDGEPPEEDTAMIVGLGRITALDPSTMQLADLPLGWLAWRELPDEPWQRALASSIKGRDA